MPELPEVETMRRGLLPIRGSKIVRVEFPEIPYRPIAITPDRDTFRTQVTNQTITDVRRIGKRILVDLNSGHSIVIQPKMAGIALLDAAPSEQHIRVIFHLCGLGAWDRFQYWDRRGLGNVCLWTPEDIEANLGPSRLGPDASVVDRSTYISRFDGVQREIKIALLDQSLICGVGNMYAAEILFAAKIHPQRRCNELSNREWTKLHQFTIQILNDAIEREGSTLKDGTYRNAINGEGSFQSQLKVYDRENKLCIRCKSGTIQRIVQAQRSTFFCVKCQK